MPNTNPITAWKALSEGNERFVAGTPEHPSQSIEHRASLAEQSEDAGADHRADPEERRPADAHMPAASSELGAGIGR